MLGTTLLVPVELHGQSPYPQTVYADDFESYGTQKNPAGWVDTSVGGGRGNGLYMTLPDPLASNNIAFGTKQSSGKPGATPRIGTFSTYTSKSFAGEKRFEYRGRFMRTDIDARVGLTFYSSYPERDQYDLIGLWQQTNSNLTMQLSAFGGGTPAGTLDSNFTPQPNRWYRFLIQSDDVGESTTIRARFWADGTAEPTAFSIDATDSSPSRLKAGRIGVWAAVRGDAYFDDITAKSPVDHTPPVVAFVDATTGATLDASAVALFKAAAKIDIKVTDDLSTTSFVAQVDGKPYAPLDAIALEGAHTLSVHAVDAPGNTTDVALRLIVDTTPPAIVLQINGAPFRADQPFNKDATVSAVVADATQVTLTTLIDGLTAKLPVVVSDERLHQITVTGVDQVGWSTTVSSTFIIDKTPPRIAFSAPSGDGPVGTSNVEIRGTSDDAVSMMVNGRTATIDTAAKTFVVVVPLSEGTNGVIATGTDAAGNTGTATLSVNVDTRAPELIIIAPAPNACVNATSIDVKGRAVDPHLKSVTVAFNGSAIPATIASTADWTATVPLSTEGVVDLAIAAADTLSHTTSSTLSVTVDRTKPTLAVTLNGAPFPGGAFNRAIVPFVRATDTDTHVAVTATLSGKPYAIGTPVAADGSYDLRATARDCAGNVSDELAVSFTIDTAAPRLVSFDPADGATIGATEVAIHGMVADDDLLTATLDATGATATVAGRTFTFGSLHLAEGANRVAITLRDRATNETHVSYTINSKSTIPSIAIVENGTPIATDAVYRRAVVPVLTSNDPTATVTATLNTGPFTSGTPVSNDGTYTLTASASDAYGHTSPAVTATFSIDRTPPTIKIDTPQNNTVVTADHIDVHVTTSEPAAVSINAVSAVNGMATIPLVEGPNAITAVATDRAGNTASDSIEITHDDGRPGIVLITPADNTATNRPTVVVSGQVLTPTLGAHVTINGKEVPVNAAGAFRLLDFSVAAGDNAITAAVVGHAASVTVHVVADFTPPTLAILANGAELRSGDRFVSSPAISLNAADDRPGVVTTVTVDGVTSADALLNLRDGGHALTAVARDAAGNETRVDRTFVVGSATASSTCAFTSLDPADRAPVFANGVRLSGRAAGAASVLVNGLRAQFADGSFVASVGLSQEGANSIVVECADSSGASIGGTQQTLTFFRYTNAPSITISSPTRSAIVGAETVVVTGTVSADVVSGDVNGIAFVPANGAFTLPKVPLTTGANIISARAKNAAGRGSVATAYVVRPGVPQIAITSPLSPAQTAAATVRISGTYVNVDPATIAITPTATITTSPSSDTSGMFSSVIPLAANTAVAITGRNAAGVSTTSTVTVTQVAGPAISIDSPSDNAQLDASRTSIAVAGSVSPVLGSLAQVNGAEVVLDAGGRYSSTVPISGSLTPIIARVATPDGKTATDAVRVLRLNGTLAVKESFPANDAVQVDPGVLIVVLFSNPLNSATARGAVTLSSNATQSITTTLFLDRDAMSIAPDIPLAPGTKYTITITQSLKDVAGGSLAQPVTFSFTTATAAPPTPPALNQTDVAGCLKTATITGAASAPGARVRLQVDGVTTATTASADRSFHFDFSFSGQPGFHVARVVEIGGDGSLSPEAAVIYRIDCAGPQLLAASLDRAARRLIIQFSKPMNSATLSASPTGTIALGALTGTVSLNSTGDTATITYDVDFTPSIVLTVTTGVQDITGLPLDRAYTQQFDSATAQHTAGDGFVAGAIYDAMSGRALKGASVVIGSATAVTNDQGAYSVTRPEGAYTIQASAKGYTTAWRQVVVRAGAGSHPLDVRLTLRGSEQIAGSGPLNVATGEDSAVTRRVELAFAAGALTAGSRVTLTAVGAEALAGLLPLGWSPAAAAEITMIPAAAIAPAKLTFVLTAADVSTITAAAQTLTLVQYDSDRDEWRVVSSVASIASDGRVSSDVQSAGSYALVYGDRAPAAQPAAPHGGAVLQGVTNVCAMSPDTCRPASKSFDFDPKSVLPNGRTVATLVTDASKGYPSGTAVQAVIDEQLNLADGRMRTDPPITTDLLLYRTAAGDSATALFNLAPTASAASETLRDGVDHVRISDYPGRVDRGALVGSEGGRVSAGDAVSMDIPTGATTDPLHVTAVAMSDADIKALGTIAGFEISGGFTLTLARGDGGDAPVTLLKPAIATLTVDTTKQVIVGEVLSATANGVIRLAATAVRVRSSVFSTFDSRFANLPIDGIVHSGRYLVLTASAPIAFTFGQVRLGTGGPAASDAIVTPAGLGVRDLTRIGGIFAVPVLARPASPFALQAWSVATGDGPSMAAGSAPDPDTAIPFGDLILTAQPPHLISRSPAIGAVLDSTAPLDAHATFDTSIDVGSALGAMTIENITSGKPLAGSADGAGNIVSFHATSTLEPASTYRVTVWPTVRSTTRAPFGQTVVWEFTTRAIPTNVAIHPELVRITLPDASGISTLVARAGALPSGDQALAIRRNHNFATQYQGTVATDGSVTFVVGDVTDVLSVNDAIDLQVIDATSHAIVAVIPLTPFTTLDGKGFLAPVDRDTRFTTSDGLVVTVPAGAFDAPTIVTAAPSTEQAFSAVPSFSTDLGYSTSVSLQFAGIANKRLDVELPIPAGADTSQPFYLGRLGDSVRGPRVMIVDILRVANGRFTTAFDQSTGASFNYVKMSRTAGPQGVISTMNGAKNFLLGALHSGVYAAVNVRPPISWAVFEGITERADIFWDKLSSLYAWFMYPLEKRGEILVPVIANQPFSVVGIDATTGLATFKKVYDPQPPGDPTAAIAFPSPIDDKVGPYPVFASPARIEMFDLQLEDVTLTSARNFEVTLHSGFVVVHPSALPLPPNSRVEVLNTTTGMLDARDDFGGGSEIKMAAAVGDRIVILIGQKNADPNAAISVVFNKPIYLEGATDNDIDAYIHARGVVKVLSREEGSAAPFADITAQVQFRSDSGNRRVLLTFDNALQLGKQYRILLNRSEIGDTLGPSGKTKLHLAALPLPAAPPAPTEKLLTDDLHLDFSTRAPGGTIATFDLLAGGVRDMSLNGNVAFVSALGGGLQAYDISDPAALGATAHAAPLATVLAGATQFWTVASDRHGRVYATGMGSTFGFIRSYRLSDFINPLPNPDTSSPFNNIVRHQVSEATVSWVPGAGTTIAEGGQTTLSDRPEGIPRKLQLSLNDSEVTYKPADLAKAFSGTTTNLGGGFVKLTIIVPDDPTLPYLSQRVTVENRALDLRWSADVPKKGSAPIAGIIARVDDDLTLLRNRYTYGIVSLFGSGIAVYDLNAVESNDSIPLDPTQPPLTELVASSNGADPSGPVPCDPAVSASTGTPCPLRDLAYSPEGLLQPTSTSVLKAFALDSNHGMLDLNVSPAAGVSQLPSVKPAGPGVTLSSSFFDAAGRHFFDQPRLQTLRAIYSTAAGVQPFARFTSTAAYQGYALIAGNQFGLLVLKLDGGALDWSSLVDVVWTPAGAYSVRVMPDGDLAVVVDGAGRVLLVDLKKINESARVPALPACTSGVCSAALFPTADKAIRSAASPPSGADWVEVGADDPRIIWKSKPHLVSGTMPPLVDPSTGFVFTGDVNSTRMNVVAASDPKLRVVVNTGNGFGEVTGIVPLGIDPRAGVVSGAEGSLGAFRIELNLPGSIADSIGRSLTLAVESERVRGAATEQTPDGFPRSHLRKTTRTGVVDPRAPSSFAMTRLLPFASGDPALVKLRYQRGYNRFTSPWIIGVADYRASEQYAWGAATAAQKGDAGCATCERPASLKGKTEADGVFELYTNGRLVAIRPEMLTPTLSVFSGTPYDYLTGRLETHLTTVPADTIRPPSIALPPRNAAIVAGAMQETYYVHSGEMQTSAVDLNAGGRGGADVILDRTYRSRTLGGTVLGAGWDATMLQRLRPLPNGNVEYRDGVGNVWLFTFRAGIDYDAPAGLYLKLVKTPDGWTLYDAEWNLTKFDPAGRLVSYSDRLTGTDPATTGNTLRYFYDDRGELAGVSDPLGRMTYLRYWTDADLGLTGAYPGLLRQVSDWRNRKIDFEYNSAGLLSTVRLPEFAGDSTLGAAYSFTGTRRPHIEYTYDAAGAAYNDRLELATNLKSIKDPAQAMLTSGTPRVSFEYDTAHRDKIRSETTPFPECAGKPCGSVVFTYPSDTQMDVVDLLGQERLFESTLATLYDKRPHLSKVTDMQVPVTEIPSKTPFDLTSAPLTATPVKIDLVTQFKYSNLGELVETVHPNGLITTIAYAGSLAGSAPQLVESVTSTGTSNALKSSFTYDTEARSVHIVDAVTHADSAGGDPVTRPDPHPHVGALTTTVTDQDTETKIDFLPSGLPAKVTTTAPGGAGLAQTTSVDYYTTGDRVALGRPKTVQKGDSTGSKFSFEFAAANTAGEKEIGEDPQLNTNVEIERDAYGRDMHRTTKDKAGNILLEERFGYDAEGRAALHTRRQSGAVVTESTAYDLLGRVIETTLDNAQVNGGSSTVHVKHEYDVGSHTVSESAPFVTAPAATTVTTSDALGRPVAVQRNVGTIPKIATSLAYDRNGSLSYESDGIRFATVHEVDQFGREILTVRSDGTRDVQTWDAANQLLSRVSFAAVATPGTASEKIAGTRYMYSKLGRQRGVSVEATIVPSYRTMTSDFSFDGQTEISRVGQTVTLSDLDAAALLRTTRTVRDAEGRVKSKMFGQGTFPVMDPKTTFSETDVTVFNGSVPQAVESVEPITGAKYHTLTTHDALGREIEVAEADGAYVSKTTYDEADNVLTSQPAGYATPWTRQYDSRSLLVREDAPEAKTTRRQYDALGTLTKYIDEAGKETVYTADELGRVTRVSYVDGTFEETTYENVTGQIASKKDRKGQWLSYFYDAGGRIADVRLGGPRDPNPAAAISGDPYLKYRYDSGGRLLAIASRDAAVQYEEYDLLGRASVTRSIRYAKRSGLSSAPEMSDAHTQRHVWTIFDHERERWRMPAAGMTLPASEPPSSWRSWIVEERDAASNITRVAAADSATAPPGASIIAATGRGVGRLAQRSRFFGSTGGSYEQTYGYADGVGSDPASGLLRSVGAKWGAVKAAGSELQRDSAKRAALATDLGLDKRTSEWRYDNRGRLTSTALEHAVKFPSTVAETLVHADFRQARTIAPDPDEFSELGLGAAQLVPPSWTATKSDAHQYVSRTLSTEPAARAYVFDSGRRTSDGVWSEEYDEEGRLSAITRGTERIEYTYDPLGRVVGRRALMQDPSGWIPETRSGFLRADGLPAETTWLWDPIVDRLVAIVEAGKSVATAPAPDAGMVRQYVHGDQAYDDPIEITTTAGRYVPLIDEGVTDSVHAIVGPSGKLSERVLYADAYGDAPRYLTGPVVDEISLTFEKDASGNVGTAKVQMHLSEAIDPATMSGGCRLAAVNASGAVVAASAVTPALTDANTILWTLDATNWKALTTASGATQLEVAVSNTLRATLWDGPVMPMPSWLLDGPDRASTEQLPVIQRKTFTAIDAFLATIQPTAQASTTPYAIHNLYLVASTTSATRTLTGFKAAPFIDPRSGFAYFRARWYDPGVGAWLTPDSVGYKDSSNLYAFAAEDPVNNSDSDGELTIIVHGTYAGKHGARNGDDSWWRDGGFTVNVDANAGDVWKIATAGNRDVGSVPELSKFGPKGKFLWGRWNNSRQSRMAAAARFAEYINTIRRLFPQEPIRVVTHSHGGNVATAATNAKNGFTPAKIDTLVVLEKPYFQLHNLSNTYVDDPYSPDPQNVGETILSTFSQEDAVQLYLASQVSHEPNWRDINPLQAEELFTRGSRVDLDPELATKFTNIELHTRVGGIAAHGVSHSRRMGRAVGIYLQLCGRGVCGQAGWQAAAARAHLPAVITDPDTGD